MVMDDSREDIELAEAGLRRLTGGADQWDDSCEAAAGEFVKLMVEANVDQRDAVRRLEGAGVSREGAWELLSAALKAKARDEKQAEEAELADATPICPHCLAPVGQFDHFCPKCAGPVTAIASFDPMGQIYSAGRAYRLAATDKRPRGVVVLGMWLIFGPSLLGLLWALSMFVSSWGWIAPGHGHIVPEDATVHAMWVILVMGLFVLYTAILWKVTAHWLESQRQAAEEGWAADDGQTGDGQTGDGQDDDGQTETRDR